ncbi:hypothetical protein BAE44_0014348 [Dichanthelium oligosanthes]|uniref:Uncharacterized protein n=1 Tax=Dichanthelium oligosanthes TaxID=888268 RepID=A0A1E5VHM4_9POAL|nr:hypothetical protein BAE44_0014348 [Dichanthelium oligosanthes]
MAANRPLFVVHTTTEGYFVYDICLENADATMEVLYGPRCRLVPLLHYRPLAVSAGTILSVTPQPRHVLPADRPVIYTAGGELRDPADNGPPIMLSFPEEIEWLEGPALYVPELGSFVGLTPRDRFLCAYKFDESGVPRWQRTWRELIPWECYYDGHTPSREMVNLAYLGKGRFCISRPVDMVDDLGRVGANSGSYSANSFLVTELRRRATEGELELAKRGTMTYQGEWGRGQCLDQYFI